MNGGRKSILLVDNNVTNLTMGKNMLRVAYNVIPVPSAAKMFEVLSDFMPDLILLDVEMPEMNGFEAIKQLKADDRYFNIPVMFLTTKIGESEVRTGLELGAADFIIKPFSAMLLLKRIERELQIVGLKKELQELRKRYENG